MANPQTIQELNTARDEAKLAILRSLRSAVEAGAGGDHVRGLAEALAWLDAPGMPHGGSVNVSR